MTHPTPTESEASKIPINRELLEAAQRLMENWKLLQERIQKIEESRDQVTAVVYERVIKDYRARIKEAASVLKAKKEEIDRELAGLYAIRQKVSGQLETHQHDLEEINFRNTLGEHSEEEYQKLSREKQEKINKFEILLTEVNANIHQYEEVFSGSESLFSEPVSKEKKIVETSEEKILREGTGPDYFSTAVGDSAFGNESLSHTEPGSPVPEDTDIKSPSCARIIIIKGENAGAAYPVKELITFGRADSNTVPLKDVKVSRQHAQIKRQGEEFVLVDLKSSNGTFVNGERIEEQVLANNDEVQLGDTVIQFQL